MKLLKEVTGFLLVLLIFFSITTGTSVYGRIVLNGSSSGYCSSSPDSTTESTNPCSNTMIDSYIEVSAAHFLNSFSIFLKVLAEVELINQQGFSQAEMLENIRSSKSELQAAIHLYNQMIEVADSTPYNPEIIIELQAFNYKDFGKVNDLDDSIFKEVQSFLGSGDVTGAYKWNIERLTKISADLELLECRVEMGEISSNSIFWKINKKFSYSLLFGQYIAEVFYSIACVE